MAENKLNRLEGVVIKSEEDLDVITMFDEEEGIEMTVKSTLWDHYEFWVESGASEFSKSVIRNGYIPRLEDMPLSYSEPNNKSYKNNKEWANSAVDKLVKAGIAVKVEKEDLSFVNPLSMAFNSTGKPRLCIDLSRCYNLRCEARKF